MKKLLLPVFLLFVNSGYADQPIQYTYDEIASNVFWNNLYVEGGWALYCGHKFSKPYISDDNKRLTIEHIYTTSRMIRALNCTSREDCYRNKKRFLTMEADLHNLYPALLDLSNAFYDSEFGDIEGEDWRYDSCDFERKNGMVEPRPLARGNIARSVFYMHSKYKLPVAKQTLRILQTWNKQDPPSQQEIVRNNKIEIIQGNRNPYIDDPELADKLVID